MKLAKFCLPLVITSGVLAPASAPAEPRGQMFIMKDRPPSGGLEKASLSHTREIHMVWPTEERGNDLTRWTVNYVAFLARPLGDFEAELTFWDVTAKGRPRLVRSDEQFTRHKDTRVLAGQLSVSSPEFERNHRYVARLTNRRVELAEVTFWLRGTPPRYDGKVTFTPDETFKVAK